MGESDFRCFDKQTSNVSVKQKLQLPQFATVLCENIGVPSLDQSET